jgi:hypothetical protein
MKKSKVKKLAHQKSNRKIQAPKKCKIKNATKD